MSQRPQTPKNPVEKRAIDVTSPSPSPSSRQPVKKKNYNLPRGGAYGVRHKPAISGAFEPLQFEPLQKPAPKRSGSCTPPFTPRTYTPPPRTPSPANNPAQNSINDMKNSTANVTSTGESDAPSSSLEEESSGNEDFELPPPVANSSFSSMQAEDPFSSPHKKVPAFKAYERLIPQSVWDSNDDEATRVKWAVQALQNAGFDSITDFLKIVYTQRFAPKTTCHRIQKFEWEKGLPKMLGLIHDHSKKHLQWRHYDLNPYRDAVTDIALDEYKREFKGFAERRDERKWCPIAQMKVGSYTSPYLRMNAKDVRPDWLATNVIKDSQLKFTTEVCFQCLFCRLYVLDIWRLLR